MSLQVGPYLFLNNFLLPPSSFPSRPPSLCAVPVQPVEQQHGGEPGEPASGVHQPLQLGGEHVCSADAVPLLAAQQHIWRPVAGASYPVKHRLPWTPLLRGHLPAVQYCQVRHLDGEFQIMSTYTHGRHTCARKRDGEGLFCLCLTVSFSLFILLSLVFHFIVCFGVSVFPRLKGHVKVTN